MANCAVVMRNVSRVYSQCQNNLRSIQFRSISSLKCGSHISSLTIPTPLSLAGQSGTWISGNTPKHMVLHPQGVLSGSYGESKSPFAALVQRRCFASSEDAEGISRTESMVGAPTMFILSYDRPGWQPLVEDEHEVMPRDAFGVPASIPPEVSTNFHHVYYIPPHFYPFLKKLGDDTAALQPYMEKLIRGQFTYHDYEEMFYKFAKSLKIYRNQIAMPYRTPEEKSYEDEVKWESAWLSYRQRVLADFRTHMNAREYVLGALIGIFFAWIWIDGHRQYRIDMKLFYLEAPEHKINWVKPRGDLI